jgi:hypothetical protein
MAEFMAHYHKRARFCPSRRAADLTGLDGTGLDGGKETVVA